MQTIQLQLLTQCNSKCVFCNKHKWKFHETMSLETIEAAFKKYPEANFIFSGGEPLMYPHLKELNDLIEKYGIVYKVFTNLTLEAQNEIEVFLNRATEISTSFDAPTEELYQSIRNCYTPGAFNNLVNNIVKYKAKTKACMVVTEQNYKLMADVFATVMFLGAEVRFYNVHTYDSMALSRYAKCWLEKKFQPRRFSKLVYDKSNLAQFVADIWKDIEPQTSCFVKNNHRVVDELGREYTCCYAFNDNGTEMDTSFAVGNVMFPEIEELPAFEMYDYCEKCTRYKQSNELYKRNQPISAKRFL
jgi:MoaA/NifB/PqqE/SkfB family radical SAM enzyme